MTAEARVCQNCTRSFTIAPEDFAFYEKIAVPPPTFCPQCRFARRLAFFNLVKLWKRECDLCGKETVSSYHPDAPYTIYCPSCWWSDRWDTFSYGRDYDFSRPFFEQIGELWRAVPLLGLATDQDVIVDSPYINYAGSLKNSYLMFHGAYDDDVKYGFDVFESRQCYDSSCILQCEAMYDCMHNYQCHKGIGFRQQADQCIDSAFLRDCSNCQNCFGSANLRSKKYYWMNEPCTKEEYAARLARWDSGSYRAYQEMKQRVEAHWDTLPYRAQFEAQSVNSSGYNFFFSKNCTECYEMHRGENSKFLHIIRGAKESYDITSWGSLELSYECCLAGGANNLCCWGNQLGAHHVAYTAMNTAASSYIFGSISIKGGQYVILNKRYAEKEYFELRAKVVAHMQAMPYTDRRGRVYRYGEYFPIELSPWAYNETLAQKVFPLDASGAEKEGYQWRAEKRHAYPVTLPAAALPDHIKETPDTVLQEVIGCGRCERGFKIVPDELAFLRQMNVPLPRECPFCRMDEKLDIWTKEFSSTTKTCTKCGATVRTPLSLVDKPVLYCTPCYQAEVL